MKRASTESVDNRNSKKRRKSSETDESFGSKIDWSSIPYEALSEPVQYHCDYCSKDISNSVRIRCAICQEFDLCTECFYTGVELRDHLPSHDYRVIDNMHFPFLDVHWSADEEQLLLEGLELFGIGNWSDVAEHISTKDKFQCQKHYEKYYLHSKTWPLPDYNHVLATRERVKVLNSGKYEKPKSSQSSPKSAAPKKSGPPKPTIQSKAPSLDELNGYMPLRDEFEIEWDNECENNIQDIVFEEGEPEEEADLKMCLLDCYNTRLNIRYQTRQFVVEKRLHDTKYQEKLTKGRSKDHQEIYNQYKRFLQVMTPEDYEALTLGLANQRALENKIQKYQNYRMKGICTKMEANRYEQEAQQREKEKNKGKRKKPSRRMAAPLELEGQPGFQLLSKQEQELCRNYQVMPMQYMSIKEALLREYLKTGDISKTTATSLFSNIDPDCSGKLFDFLQEVGWINNRVYMNPAIFDSGLTNKK